MNTPGESELVAIEVIEQIKKLSGDVDVLLIVASQIMLPEDFEALRLKSGEFLGYLYFDVFSKYVSSKHPDFKHALE